MILFWPLNILSHIARGESKIHATGGKKQSGGGEIFDIKKVLLFVQIDMFTKISLNIKNSTNRISNQVPLRLNQNGESRRNDY